MHCVVGLGITGRTSIRLIEAGGIGCENLEQTKISA